MQLNKGYDNTIDCNWLSYPYGIHVNKNTMYPFIRMPPIVFVMLIKDTVQGTFSIPCMLSINGSLWHKPSTIRTLVSLDVVCCFNPLKLSK